MEVDMSVLAWAIPCAAVCVVILIYAIKELIDISSFQRSINEQSPEEIDAVKNTNWSELRSKERMEELQRWLMIHIKPRLQCPGSAVICPADEMLITGPNAKGKFKITGYVDSQNGFGAMKRANFNATTHYNPNTGSWTVEKVSLLEF